MQAYQLILQSVDWWIPKEVWLKFDLNLARELDIRNENIKHSILHLTTAYRCELGEGKTWVETKTFGMLYKFTGNASDILYFSQKYPEIKQLIGQWNKDQEKAYEERTLLKLALPG